MTLVSTTLVPTATSRSTASVGGTIDVVPGVLDEAAKEAFSFGQCHALAMALSKRLGLPLVALVYFDADYDDCYIDDVLVRSADGLLPDALFSETWSHALVHVGPDRYLDVYGVRSGDEIKAQFCCGEDFDTYCFVPTSTAQLSVAHAFGEFGVAPDMATADLFVDAVLSAY